MSAAPSHSLLSLLNTRAAVLIVSIFAFILTIFQLAPYSKSILFAVLFTDGFVALAWIASAAAAGAAILRLFKIATNPLLLLSTAAALGLGIFSLLALALGLLGLLNHAVALAMPILAVLFFALIWQKEIRSRKLDFLSIKKWLQRPANLSWLWLIPVISLAIAIVAASVMPGVLWKPLDPHPYDVLSYHLQVPREWYELGRIIPLNHNVFSYFPFNVEMQYLLLMHLVKGPWEAMYLCQFLSVGYTALTLLAIAGAISPSGKPVIGAAIASTVPWVIMLAGVAYVESALLLYTTLAVAWTMQGNFGFWIADSNHESQIPNLKFQISNFKSQISNFPIILAGVMAGFACGVKITAVPMLLAAIPIALLITALLHPPRKLRPTLLTCILFVAIGAFLLSPWLIRDVIWAGNPIFPVAMKTLGHAHFSPDQIERFRIAHSPTPAEQSLPARLQIVWTDILAHWQFGYILLPAGLLAAVFARRDRRMIFLLLTAGISFFVWIAFTHLLARFLVILIPMAAIAFGQFPWKKSLPLAIALVILAAILGWANIYQPLTDITRDSLHSALVGREDLSFMIPPELADIANSTKQVGLVGDAEAFLYQIPMTRLHYRTIFDLPSNITDPISAWINPQARNDPDWLFVINPAEIDRLHHTYYKTPPLPPQWKTADELPFVLQGGQIKN